MEEYDLHGKTVKEAEELFMSFLNRLRLARGHQRVSFITGVGAIQARFITLCEETGLEYEIPFHNRGVIQIKFE